AEAAVKDKPPELARVRRERLVLEHLQLTRYNFLQRARQLKKENDNADAAIATTVKEFEALAKDWIERSKQAGVRHVSESQMFDGYAGGVMTRGEGLIPPKLPKPGDALPAG